jgi:hypothetical protein
MLEAEKADVQCCSTLSAVYEPFRGAGMTHFAPRALLHRQLIDIAVPPFELSVLVASLETLATHAAEDPARVDYADWLFCRVAELREACR